MRSCRRARIPLGFFILGGWFAIPVLVGARLIGVGPTYAQHVVGSASFVVAVMAEVTALLIYTAALQAADRLLWHYQAGRFLDADAFHQILRVGGLMISFAILSGLSFRFSGPVVEGQLGVNTVVLLAGAFVALLGRVLEQVVRDQPSSSLAASASSNRA